MNSITIMGRLGDDPVFKELKNGKHICSFNVATNKKKNEKEYTEWHSIVVFDDLAILCNENLKKGLAVMIVGEMNSRKYTPKNQEISITKKEIHAQHISVPLFDLKRLSE